MLRQRGLLLALRHCYSSFNSLFEMRRFMEEYTREVAMAVLSILYLRCRTDLAVWRPHPSERTPFNSLFEMHVRLRLLGPREEPPFNSLFEMPSAGAGDCRRQAARYAFNSLFEMPSAGAGDCRRQAARYAFNSLFEMPVYQARREAVPAGHFQFSI